MYVSVWCPLPAPCLCLVHRSHGNVPHFTPPPAGLVSSCLCSFSFLSSLTLDGEGAAPIIGLPPSLLVPVPCGTSCWGQVLPFCPFRIVFVPILNWKVPLFYVHNEWRVPLSSQLNPQPGNPQILPPLAQPCPAQPASAFSLALVCGLR